MEKITNELFGVIEGASEGGEGLQMNKQELLSKLCVAILKNKHETIEKIAKLVITQNGGNPDSLKELGLEGFEHLLDSEKNNTGQDKLASVSEFQKNLNELDAVLKMK